MANSPFIGTGHNPEGVDLPLGFGMRLAQEPRAMDTFGILDEAGKARVVSYIQAATNGDEAKNRIETAVNSLSHGQIPS
jgi:uncharacterized protein YdeI (YjbR/CyaY-like superfamily)